MLQRLHVSVEEMREELQAEQLQRLQGEEQGAKSLAALKAEAGEVYQLSAE